MESLIPLDEFLGIIKMYYYGGVYSNKPFDLKLAMRIYILQNLYDLTSANVHDVTITSELLRGKENEIYDDSGYSGADKREGAIISNKKSNIKSSRS